MHKKLAITLAVFTAVLIAVPTMLHAQVEFKLADRQVQVHGFAGQGFVYTSGNNWLTMKSNDGSGQMTEMGLNMSTQLTNRWRAGAQVYARNLGHLGQYHPSLDWASLDFRFKPWLSFRGGKVKTTMGLYTDTQDLDFLHTFALMPQSIYPIDLRDATIAHSGGDVYGRIPLKNKAGALSYTVFGGHRNDSMYSGYPYFMKARGTTPRYFGGIQYGADLRWETPLKGLLVGVSRMNEYVQGLGSRPGNPNGGNEHTAVNFTTQFFGEYTRGNLRLDAEFKRFFRDEIIRNGAAEDKTNVHGWYVAGSYRLCKYLELGSYYSHYTVTSTFLKITDTSTPGGHDYDKVISGRVDINRYWNVKVEGHFMDGYGYAPYPNGFYPQENPTFKPGTRALVLHTGVNF